MKVVFYDLETTGTDDQKHEIIQIAAIAFEVNGSEWKELEQFEAKVNFHIDQADPEALEKNCYDEAVWSTEAISQEEAISRFDRFAQKYKDVERKSKRTGRLFYCVRTAGHNVKGFDDKFIRKWYQNHSMFCPFDYAEVLDTLQLSMWKVHMIGGGFDPKPDNFKLETMCKCVGVDLDNAHDALDDIRANARLAWKLTR
jgi:DNA polymerase-3 subunit epsilon